MPYPSFYAGAKDYIQVLMFAEQALYYQNNLPSPRSYLCSFRLSFLIGFLKFKFCSLTSQTDKLAYFCMNNKKVIWIGYPFQKSFIRPNCTHGINSFFQFLSSYSTMLTSIISYLLSGVLSATNFSSNSRVISQTAKHIYSFIQATLRFKIS